MKISTIYFKDDSLYDKIDEIAHRERKSISELTRVALEEYVKVHGSGNPVYSLDSWTANPKFVAVPALLADYDFIKNWMKNADQKTISEVTSKIQSWSHLLKQKEYDRL